MAAESAAASATGTAALATTLAGFAHGLRRPASPEPAAAHATMLILDAVGCALAGWAAEETPQVLRAAQVLGGHGESTIIGDARPASLITSVTVERLSGHRCHRV